MLLILNSKYDRLTQRLREFEDEVDSVSTPDSEKKEMFKDLTACFDDFTGFIIELGRKPTDTVINNDQRASNKPQPG